MVRFAGYRLTRAEPEEQGEGERSLRSSFSIHNCDWAEGLLRFPGRPATSRRRSVYRARWWAGLAVFLIVLVVNISMWVISLKNLKRGYHKAQHDPEDKKQDVLLDRRYIIPLVVAFGWLVGDWVLPGVALLLQERVSS